MTTAASIFTPQQTDQLVKAIKAAELRSSAEIRIHVENHCKHDVLDRATEVFDKLGMQKTEAHNGVLIYLAVKDHKVAIIGDKGINAAVPREFWQECYQVMASRFKNEQYVEGICDAVAKFGEGFGEHFPHQKDDVNELSDEISFG